MVTVTGLTSTDGVVGTLRGERYSRSRTPLQFSPSGATPQIAFTVHRGLHLLIGLAGKGATTLALFLCVVASGSACAMSSTSIEQLRCIVRGQEKLAPELGGEAAICSAIRRTAAPVLQKAGIAPAAVSISVEVRSQYTISAVASVGSITLPAQYVAASDRPLQARSIEMLAEGVALELSKLH